MDVQLQELIDKIKSEGVSAAQSKADEIIHEAEQKAHKIIDDAQVEADGIVDVAKQKEAQSVQAGIDALAQAARDLLLSLQSQIVSVFNTVIQEEAEQALSGAALESAIATLIGSWTVEEAKNIDVLLNESDLASMEKSLQSKLAQKINSGLEIKIGAGLTSGFRVSMKDGSSYYNFTPAEIAAVLSEFLNPRLTEILQQAVS